MSYPYRTRVILAFSYCKFSKNYSCHCVISILVLMYVYVSMLPTCAFFFFFFFIKKNVGAFFVLF